MGYYTKIWEHVDATPTPFLPSDIPNLGVWVEADVHASYSGVLGTTAVIRDNAPSPFGGTFVVLNGSSTAVLSTNILSGKAAYVFNNGADWGCYAKLSGSLIIGSVLHVFWVDNFSGTNQSIVDWFFGTDSQWGANISRNLTGLNDITFGNNAPGAVGAQSSPVATGYAVFELIKNESSGYWYRNGVNIGTSVIHSGSLAPTWAIGPHSYFNSVPLKGNLVGVVAYHGYLSNSDASSVRKYFINKYRLTTATQDYQYTEWITDSNARTFEGGTGTWLSNGATMAQGTVPNTGAKSLYLTFGSTFSHGIELVQYSVGTIEHYKTATASWRHHFSTYTGYWIIQAYNGATNYRWDSVYQAWSTGVFLTASCYFPTGTFDNWVITAWYPSGGTDSRIFIDDVSLKT